MLSPRIVAAAAALLVLTGCSLAEPEGVALDLTCSAESDQGVISAIQRDVFAVGDGRELAGLSSVDLGNGYRVVSAVASGMAPGSGGDVRDWSADLAWVTRADGEGLTRIDSTWKGELPDGGSVPAEDARTAREAALACSTSAAR